MPVSLHAVSCWPLSAVGAPGDRAKKRATPFEFLHDASNLHIDEWLADFRAENEVIQMLIHPVWWVSSLGCRDFYYHGIQRQLDHPIATRLSRTC